MSKFTINNTQKNDDITDKARAYLVDLLPSQYEKYIKTRLAGDFAVALVNELECDDDAVLEAYYLGSGGL